MHCRTSSPRHWLLVFLRLGALALAAALGPAGDLALPSEVAFWEAAYAEKERLGVKAFGHAWQGIDLNVLRDALSLELHPNHRVLVLGAGDSGLPEELFDAGCRNVTAVDFSTRLVAAMAERSHGAMWRAEDARHMSLPEANFDFVFDIGLLDTVAAGGDEGVLAVLSESHRVLSRGGTYVSVSTEPPLYRLPLFNATKAGDGWTTKVLFIPRPRSIDPRVRRIDPALDMGKLSVYVSTKPEPKVVAANSDLALDAESSESAQMPSEGDSAAKSPPSGGEPSMQPDSVEKSSEAAVSPEVLEAAQGTASEEVSKPDAAERSSDAPVATDGAQAEQVVEAAQDESEASSAAQPELDSTGVEAARAESAEVSSDEPSTSGGGEAQSPGEHAEDVPHAAADSDTAVPPAEGPTTDAHAETLPAGATSEAAAAEASDSQVADT